MKKLLVCSTVCLSLSLGLLIFGCASKPPSAWEQHWFNITTNYVPQVSVQTNVIPVTIIQTNIVVVTNAQSVVEYRTNVVPILSYQTNAVTVTNLAEQYSYKPGAPAQEVQGVGAAIGNLFGLGGVVSTALAGLFSLYGYVRSTKNHAAATNLAQTVETMREFVKSLPNGAQYDQVLVNWMQTHQAEQNVIQDVVRIVSREVSNPDAQAASQQILALLNSLRNLTTPPPPAKA